MMRTVAGLVLVLTGVLMAPAWAPAWAQPAIGIPAGQAFRAETLNGRDLRGARATFTLQRDGRGWRAGGSTGCNSWSAAVRIAGRRLTTGPVMATRRACAPPLMQVERDFVRVLDSSPNWRLEGRRLVLESRAGRITLVREGR